MIQQFDTVQKFGKDGMDAVMKSFGSVSKGTQALAVEAADFAKSSFEHGTATIEKLTAVRSLEKAMEVQGEFLKSSIERFVAQSSKMGELCAGVAKEAMQPYETLVAAKMPSAS